MPREVLLVAAIMVLGLILVLVFSLNPSLRGLAAASPLTYGDQVTGSFRAVGAIALGLVVYEVFTYDLRTSVVSFWLSVGMGLRRLLARAYILLAACGLVLAVTAYAAYPYPGMGLMAVAQLVGDYLLVVSVAMFVSVFSQNLLVVLLVSVALPLLLRSAAFVFLRGSPLAAVLSPWPYYFNSMAEGGGGLVDPVLVLALNVLLACGVVLLSFAGTYRVLAGVRSL